MDHVGRHRRKNSTPAAIALGAQMPIRKTTRLHLARTGCSSRSALACAQSAASHLIAHGRVTRRIAANAPPVSTNPSMNPPIGPALSFLSVFICGPKSLEKRLPIPAQNHLATDKHR